MSFVSIFQRFIFKSQVIATDKFDIKKGKDFVWVTKDELLEYFPEQAEYLDKMIISLWCRYLKIGTCLYSDIFLMTMYNQVSACA